MTAPENVTATHLRDLFYTSIIEMRQAQSELVTAQLRMHTESMAGALFHKEIRSSPANFGKNYVTNWTYEDTLLLLITHTSMA